MQYSSLLSYHMVNGLTSYQHILYFSITSTNFFPYKNEVALYDILTIKQQLHLQDSFTYSKIWCQRGVKNLYQTPQTLDFTAFICLKTSLLGFPYMQIYTFLLCSIMFYQYYQSKPSRGIMFYIVLYTLHRLAYLVAYIVNAGVNTS